MEKLRLRTSICFRGLVQKLIQKSFQTIEQKLVQRYETKVGADACKAS